MLLRQKEIHRKIWDPAGIRILDLLISNPSWIPDFSVDFFLSRPKHCFSSKPAKSSSLNICQYICNVQSFVTTGFLHNTGTHQVKSTSKVGQLKNTILIPTLTLTSYLTIIHIMWYKAGTVLVDNYLLGPRPLVSQVINNPIARFLCGRTCWSSSCLACCSLVIFPA